MPIAKGMVAVAVILLWAVAARGQSRLLPIDQLVIIAGGPRPTLPAGTQPLPETQPSSPTSASPPNLTPSTRPAAEADDDNAEKATEAYDTALCDAKAAYLKTLLGADGRLIRSLDKQKQTAEKAGDTRHVERAEAQRDAARDRQREHEIALKTLLAPDHSALIASARWGTGRDWEDVTDQVRLLTEQTTRTRANPTTLDADPAPGWKKVLEIVYFHDGEGHTAVVHEDDEIEVPGLVPKAADRLEADERASHGTASRRGDPKTR